MFNLHILDVSALLHFGMNSVRYKDRMSCGYCVGGIHKVMRQIAIAASLNDSIILAFDSKSNFRKRIMPGYKAGRVSNKFVISQAELLWEKLPKIGIPCYKFDGFEGDDIISWACSEHEKYNNVYIHANDKDLIHNVRGNIIFHSISEENNRVTEANFPYAIEKGVQVPFNYISVKKVLTGCTSDKVPAFKAECGLKGSELFNWYVDVLPTKFPSTYQYTANPDLFMQCMHCIPDLTENDFAELEKRIKVIFPAKRPADVDITAAYAYKLNQYELADFLSLVNDYETIKAFGLRKKDLSQEERDYLRDLQRSLATGEFAVDRNMSVNETFDDSLLTLKEF